MAPTVGQKRRKKKKNKKSGKRRLVAVQIKHPKEVPAFDEFDGDDAVEEELSDEVASDKDSRDEKSRHVLKRFMARYIPYLRSVPSVFATCRRTMLVCSSMLRVSVAGAGQQHRMSWQSMPLTACFLRSWLLRGRGFKVSMPRL